jgi:thiamine-phosphate diphosphorylase
VAIPTVTRAERSARLRGIYCIVNEGARTPLEIATGALRGGVRVLQYRAKNGIEPEHVHALRELTHFHDALLILNDDWRAALDLDCDGVHLGPDDSGFTDAELVRAAFGERIVGLSCGTVAEARAALPRDVDYVGVGPVFATASKEDAGAPIGIADLIAVAAATALPVAAIGGITSQNVPDVRRSGVAMAAVISAIADARDAGAAAKMLVDLWNAPG